MVLRACVFLLLLGPVVQFVSALSGPAHFYPFGPTRGDSTAPVNDDGSTEEIAIDIGFPYFDNVHNSLYVNTNGAISFLGELSQYSPEPFPLDTNRRLITPFWTDVDTRQNDGRVYYRETTASDVLNRASQDVRRAFVDLSGFSASWVFIATWYRVTFFGGSSTTPVNTFQAVLITDGVYSFSIFNYDSITWTVGTANRETPAQVGFNAGDGINYMVVEGSRTPAIVDIDEATNVGLPGRLMFRVDSAVITAGGCNSAALLSMGPRYDTTFGGTIITIAGPCFEEVQNEDVTCRFDETHNVTGQIIDATRATCRTPPLLVRPGRITLDVSTNGGSNYSHSGHFIIVRDEEYYGVTLPNVDDIAFTDLSDRLRVVWDKSLINASHVDLDFVIFSWSDTTQSEVQLVEVPLMVNTDNTGDLLLPSRLPQPETLVFSTHGAVRIRSNGVENGAILWSVEHSATWYVNTWTTETLANAANPSPVLRLRHVGNSPLAENSRWAERLLLENAQTVIARLANGLQNGYEWILQEAQNAIADIKIELQDKLFGTMCKIWAQEIDIAYVPPPSALPCPCNRNQANNEVRFTGRFQNDGACNNGEGCQFHKGAEHCIRSTSPDLNGGGQQCCYAPGRDGPLIVTSPGGGTYDRYHGDSLVRHFLHDVATWMICCGLSDNCQIYSRRRPTNNCSDYDGLGAGFGTGDPHITTLDDFQYTFNGHGEYVLAQVPEEGFIVQGRMAPTTNTNTGAQAAGTVWKSFVARANGTDTVEIRYNARTSLDVLVNGQLENFNDLPNQIFSGLYIYANTSDRTARVFFDEVGIGLTVNQISDAMNFVLMIPTNLKGKFKGLLGNFDGDPSNDLRTPNGQVLTVNSSDEDIHDGFGESWRIQESDSLFTYEPGQGFNDNNVPSYRPVFFSEVLDYDTDLLARAEVLCHGVRSCIFDYLVTGDEELSYQSLEQAIVYGDAVGSLQKHCTADIVFLVDVIWAPAEWLQVKETLMGIIQSLDVDSGDIRIALILFCSHAKIVYNLDDFINDGAPALNMLRTIDAIQVGNTTSPPIWPEALQLATDDLLGSSGDRPSALNYVVMITGGQPMTMDFQRAILLADVIKMRATLVTVGVGPGLDRLAMLASPGPENTLFYDDTGRMLQDKDAMVSSLCRAAVIPEPLPTTAVPTAAPTPSPNPTPRATPSSAGIPSSHQYIVVLISILAMWKNI